MITSNCLPGLPRLLATSPVISSWVQRRMWWKWGVRLYGHMPSKLRLSFEGFGIVGLPYGKHKNTVREGFPHCIPGLSLWFNTPCTAHKVAFTWLIINFIVYIALTLNATAQKHFTIRMLPGYHSHKNEKSEWIGWFGGKEINQASTKLLLHVITSTAKTLFSDSSKELVHKALSIADMARIVQHGNLCAESLLCADLASRTGGAGTRRAPTFIAWYYQHC